MSDGKRTTAPCGHEGEYVIGQYVRCLIGCDQPGDFAVDFDDEVSGLVVPCPRCPCWNSVWVRKSELEAKFNCSGCGIEIAIKP